MTSRCRPTNTMITIRQRWARQNLSVLKLVRSSQDLSSGFESVRHDLAHAPSLGTMSHWINWPHYLIASVSRQGLSTARVSDNNWSVRCSLCRPGRGYLGWLCARAFVVGRQTTRDLVFRVDVGEVAVGDTTAGSNLGVRIRRSVAVWNRFHHVF